MRRIWMPWFVAAVACSAAPADMFVERPADLKRVYPSAEDFHAVGGRRLRAEDGKPSRRRYELESHGIVYEYAANRTAPQVLNVDEATSVLGVACESAAAAAAAGTALPEAAQAVLSLLWTSAEAGTRLGAGAVVGGGPGWRCLAAGEGSKPSDFLFEVISVLQQPDLEAPATVLAVRWSTIFEVYQDLFIDYSWTPKVPTPGRKLNGDDEEALFDQTFDFWQFNYDASTERAEQEIPIVDPVLKCTDCFARIGARFQLMLETTGKIPKKAAFKVWPELEAKVQLDLGSGLSPEDIDLLRNARGKPPSEWNKIPDMAMDVVEVEPFTALSMPLFGQINEFTLNMMGRVRLEFLTQLKDVDFADELWQGTLFAAYFSTKGAFVEIGWETERGFYLDANFEYDMKTSNLNDMTNLNPAFTRMVTGLRPCANFALTVGGSGDQELTGFRVCTDMQTGFVFNPPPEKRAPVVAAMQRDVLEPDSRLCLRFLSFATDADLDVGTDDPVAQACVFGRCVETPHFKQFQGQVVTWDDEDHCFDVAKAWLHNTPVWLQVFEKDHFWDDEYTDRFEYIIPEDCLAANGCVEDLVLIEVAGTFARLKLSVSVQSLRRLSDSSSTTPDCLSNSVSFQLGMVGGFNGVKFPHFFKEGADHVVVDPVWSPALQPHDPVVICIGGERTNSMISAALPASIHHGLAALVMCLGASASAVGMHSLW